jgi:hypothetical protein
MARLFCDRKPKLVPSHLIGKNSILDVLVVSPLATLKISKILLVTT